MKVGSLRNLFTVLDNNSTALGTRGQITAGSTEVAKVRGSIKTLAGREGVLVQQLHPTATHVIRCWKPRPTTITRDMRLSLGSRTFFINSMDDTDGIGQELKLVVTEEV